MRAQGWDPHNGISSFTRRGGDIRTFCLHQVQIQQEDKVSVCKPGRGPSPRNESAGTLTFDFSASRTCLSLLVYGVLLQQPEQAKTATRQRDYLMRGTHILPLQCVGMSPLLRDGAESLRLPRANMDPHPIVTLLHIG